MNLPMRAGAQLVLLALAACATATPYQPLSGDTGYTEQRLEANRYRVSFAGNSSTPRETVETYLLYRAAELTLDNQYDWFTLSARDTEAAPAKSGFSFGIGGFSGGSHSGVGLGVGTGTPRTPEYSNSAEVVMYKGTKPDNDPHAYNARELQANLAPRIVRPGNPS